MAKKKNKGWIRIYRQIEDNEIWDNDEPFDIRSAWIDLILMANHEDRTILINGHPQLIDVGQKWISVRALAVRWHWSKDRVMRYTKMLEKLGMITMNKTPTGTLITIVNYELFQGVRDTNKDTGKDTNKDTGKDTDKDETRIIKNYKNEKEGALPRRTNLLNGKRQ